MPRSAVEIHPYPSCTIPLPSDDERVVQIEPNAQDQFASHHVGDLTRGTAVIDISIAPNDHRDYIVLPSVDRTIWRFSGATDSVSRIINLDTEDQTGIIGIPKDRIHGPTPDLDDLPQPAGEFCTVTQSRCRPDQWFGPAPPETVTFHPQPHQARKRSDVVVDGQPPFDPDLLAFDYDAPPDPIILAPGSYPTALVQIDPQRVVSARPPQRDDVVPDQLGLESLVADGTLLPEETEDYDAVLRRFH